MQKSNDLQAMFIESARNWIMEFESSVLDLEKSPHNRELLNNIFRIAHNIKGCSGNTGLSDINRFAHIVEDSLDLIRQNKLVPNRQLITSLLEATDLISEMVEAAASKKSFDFARCQIWINDINKLKKKNMLI